VKEGRIIMTKEDLKEYRHICEELRHLDDKRDVWMARAERSTRPPSEAPVMCGVHDPMPHIMDKLTGIREQADGLTARLYALKLRIELAIESRPPVQRRVMRARYIDGKCWEAIAKEMGYSVQRLFQIHKAALLEMVKKD
jgi:DNA-directed RNA polymerase specialized sigma24 family protein